METMLEAAGPALLALLSPSHLFYLCLGTGLGLVVGVLPGLGGIAGLSLVLPFIFGMEPSQALALMIGLLAPTATSDTFPAVLMGVPGTSGSQATVVDGFPLAKQGEGARALGAAFTASLLGGLFGALVLTFTILAARPVILAIGFGEQLMLVLFGLSMIGMLTGASVMKGLATCGLGLLLGSMGAAPATGEVRLAFDTVYLSDGVPLVIVGLAMFAIPEIIDLLRRQQTIAAGGQLGKGWLTGFFDTLRHKWLVLRCSTIGCLVGALPGLGGSVVDWIAYGHTVQTSRDKSRFGHGDIRGVIGPESANNAKEGGALMPTLLFGIPGTGSMALLLGGFILIGIEPGVGMLTRDLDLTFTIIWSLALANVLGAAACLMLAQPISRLTTIPYALIGPCMLVLVFFAAFQATRSWGDLIALLVTGILGVYMKRFGWPRPALLIGYVLSPRLESSVYQTVQVYGWGFLERPVVVVIGAIIVATVVIAIRQSSKRDDVMEAARVSCAGSITPQVVFTGAMLLAGGVAMADALTRSWLGQIYPLYVAIVTLLLLAGVLASQLLRKSVHVVFFDQDRIEPAAPGIPHFLVWIGGMLLGAALVGFPIAISLFVFAYTMHRAGDSPRRNVVLALGTAAFLAVMAYSLTLVYPAGLLQQFVDMPWWLG